MRIADLLEVGGKLHPASGVEFFIAPTSAVRAIAKSFFPQLTHPESLGNC
ncbi:hypothetical protein [Nostoc sp.]